MINLHNHSNYSILQGTIPIEELIGAVKADGMPCVSLTDTNGMYGSIKFAKKAKEENLKAILGVLIDDPKSKELNALFLAKNNEGYSSLCQIVTSRKLKEDFSLIKLLDEDLQNLIVITASIDLLRILSNIDRLRKNLYVELISTKKHKMKTRELYNFARTNNLQIVASNPTYFLNTEDHLLHKVVAAIKENTTLENISEDEVVDEEYYLKSNIGLEKTWHSLPEAILNAEKIANLCNVDLEFGKNKFPIFP